LKSSYSNSYSRVVISYLLTPTPDCLELRDRPPIDDFLEELLEVDKRLSAAIPLGTTLDDATVPSVAPNPKLFLPGLPLKAPPPRDCLLFTVFEFSGCNALNAIFNLIEIYYI
jgi:hypothetical protein